MAAKISTQEMEYWAERAQPNDISFSVQYVCIQFPVTSFAATQYQKWLSGPDALIKVACLFTEVPGNREIVMHAIPLSFLMQENRVAVSRS